MIISPSPFHPSNTFHLFRETSHTKDLHIHMPRDPLPWPHFAARRSLLRRMTDDLLSLLPSRTPRNPPMSSTPKTPAERKARARFLETKAEAQAHKATRAPRAIASSPSLSAPYRKDGDTADTFHAIHRSTMDLYLQSALELTSLIDAVRTQCHHADAPFATLHCIAAPIPAEKANYLYRELDYRRSLAQRCLDWSERTAAYLQTHDAAGDPLSSSLQQAEIIVLPRFVLERIHHLNLALKARTAERPDPVNPFDLPKGGWIVGKDRAPQIPPKPPVPDMDDPLWPFGHAGSNGERPDTLRPSDTDDDPLAAKAWHMLTSDMAGGLHQFDHWDEVPAKLKATYLDKAMFAIDRAHNADVPKTQNPSTPTRMGDAEFVQKLSTALGIDPTPPTTDPLQHLAALPWERAADYHFAVEGFRAITTQGRYDVVRFTDHGKWSAYFTPLDPQHPTPPAAIGEHFDGYVRAQHFCEQDFHKRFPAPTTSNQPANESGRHFMDDADDFVEDHFQRSRAEFLEKNGYTSKDTRAVSLPPQSMVDPETGGIRAWYVNEVNPSVETPERKEDPQPMATTANAPSPAPDLQELIDALTDWLDEVAAPNMGKHESEHLYRVASKFLGRPFVSKEVAQANPNAYRRHDPDSAIEIARRAARGPASKAASSPRPTLEQVRAAGNPTEPRPYFRAPVDAYIFLKDFMNDDLDIPRERTSNLARRLAGQ